MGGKQADRNAKKKAVKEEEADVVAAPTRTFTDMAKVLFLGSAIMQVAPGMQGIMTDDSKAKAPEKKEDEKEKVEGEEEPKESEASLAYADQVFSFLKKRLVWFNCLGLAEPASAEEAMAAWLELKDLEIDYGPRPKRNQSPGLDRIKVPLEKCPLKFRVAASVGIHLLVWFFFLFETLWKMWFPEKFLVLGLIAYHAYAVRPADKSKTN